MDPLLAEMNEWIARFRDGELSPAEAARLNDRLATDAAARELWASHLLMQIHLESKACRSGRDCGVGDGKSVRVRGAGAEEKAVQGLPASGSPVLGFLGGIVSYVSHSRMLMFWLMFGTLEHIFRGAFRRCCC